MRTFILLMSCFLAAGCAARRGGNEGQLQSYPFKVVEASWVREGEPIEFEGELWYPQDGIESLLDSEVMYAGLYRDVQFFIDKIDVRPYNRLYTKFGINKFRYFERKVQHDPAYRSTQSVQ